MYRRACQSRYSELIALPGLHRGSADELDKLWLIGEAADKRERIDRLLWRLFRSAREPDSGYFRATATIAYELETKA